jgi:hypothetical protein
MKDNSLHNDENWKGSLSDKFDSENIAAPDQAWNQIEDELFPKKKRRFAAFWFLMAGVFISGLFFMYLNSGNDEINNQPILISEKETPKEHEKQKGRGKESNNQREKNKEFEICDNNSKNLETKNQQIQNTSNKKKPQKVLTESSKFTENNLSNNSKSTKKEENRVTETIISTHSNTSTSLEDQLVLQEEKNDQQDNLIPPKSINSGLHAMDSTLYLKPFPILPMNVALSPELKLLAEEDLETTFDPYFSFQIAPLVGSNIRIISGTFNADSPTSSALGEKRVALRKYGFLIGTNYHVTNQFSINTGFQMASGDVQTRWFFKYLYVEPNSNELRLSTNSGEATTSDPTLIESITNGNSNIYKLRINHSFALYSVPLGITYRITQERFSPFFKMGINAEFFGKRTMSIDVQENNISKNIIMNLEKPNTPVILQSILSLGIQGSINESLKLFSEASYNVPLINNLKLNGAKVKNAGSSLVIGIQFNFGNLKKL